MPFDGCPPEAKFPGDDAPVIWGTCDHAFHLQCINRHAPWHGRKGRGIAMRDVPAELAGWGCRRGFASPAPALALQAWLNLARDAYLNLQVAL